MTRRLRQCVVPRGLRARLIQFVIRFFGLSTRSSTELKTTAQLKGTVDLSGQKLALPIIRSSRFALVGALLVAAPALLPAAWQIESESNLVTSPNQSLVIDSGQNGFTVYDRASMTRQFVVRQAGATPRLFSADGRVLFFTNQTGLSRLDLTSGEITPLATLPFVQSLFQNDATGDLLALVGSPNQWRPTSFQLHRIDPTGRSPAQPLDVMSPEKLPWIEVVQMLPSRAPADLLLLWRESGEPDNEFDARKGGDFVFTEVSLNAGTIKRLSSLTPPSDDFYLTGPRWTNTDRAVLEESGYTYTLIDPYAGEITRELKVPKVRFQFGEPGQIIAIGERVEEGEVRYYHDYLESGTLKTIRNVRVADAKVRPPRPSEPEPVVLPDFPPDPSSYRFASYAFHPTKPEFFTTDDTENVHLFRLTSSGLKYQSRGRGAYWARYTPDGQNILFERLGDPPTEQIAADLFPSPGALVYEDPPLITPAPVYTGSVTISPSGDWLVKSNNRDATLHRFGESAIVESLGGVRTAEYDYRMPEHVFASDESTLFRLIWDRTYNEADELLDTPTVEALPFADLSIETKPRWSLSLPHGDIVWLDDIVDAQLRFLDVRAGQLLTLDASDGTIRSVDVAGLDSDKLTSGQTFSVQPDASLPRIYVGFADQVITLDFSGPTPRASFASFPDRIAALHRYGDQRHLVALLETGRLLFLDTQTDDLRLALTLDITERDSGAYLASTADGRFDASASLRDTGYLLAGTRPIPLSSVFNRDYQPDLLATALGPDALAPDDEMIAYVQPPSLSVETIWRNALTYYLAFTAESAQHPLAEVAIYQNDKLIRTFPGGEVAGRRSGFEVELLLEQNRFKVVATNSVGISTTSPEIVLDPPEALLREKLAARRPAELHLLVVGVNEYRNPEYNLNFAVADASGMLAKLEAANRELFPKINRHYLSNAQATHDGILAAFAEIRRAAQPHDAFLFYFAGHGVMSKSDQQFYLIPHDVTRIYGESQSLTANGLSAQKLRDLSADISAQKQLFILDACNSGGALQAFAQRGASQEKALAQLARATGTHWIAASSSTQFATEFADLGHGAFTHTLLQALDGAADTGDKRITINELKAYLESELPAVTQRYKGAPQYPSSYGYGQDFPIALLP